MVSDMIHTENFKTKTMLLERDNHTRSRWNIGLDIGYSAVKGFSPNTVFCFPAFAKRVPEQYLSVARAKDSAIQYKDLDTGEIWNVGESAQEMSGTNDNELAVYGRVRYFNKMFKVISEVGIGIGMLENKYGKIGNASPFVQTGLPPEYRISDESDLKEALAGKHHFAIKIGEQEWKEFNFELPIENIDVIDQPMGTLFSISTLNNGRTSVDAAKYFNSNILIADAGFGTLDVYNINKGRVATRPETIDNLGMKQVFKETIHEIFEKYKKEITVSEMQKLLQTGKFRQILKQGNKRISKEIDFADILERNNEKVCTDMLTHICSAYNNLIDHDYLVITGGTCNAWSNIIRDYFSGMETLKVISGAQNDNLSAVFANARGYYMYALNKR